jgi:uncharacterized membrane protein YfhO
LKKRKKAQSQPVEKPEIKLLPGNRDLTVWYCLGGLAVIWAVCFSQILFGIGNLWEDAILLEYPHRIFARDSFLSFEFPHWNPYSFNGMPFFASQLPGVLYPVNVLLSFISAKPAVYWYIIELSAILHVLAAGVSMFFFLKYKKVSSAAGFVGAVGFMLSGFMVTHLVHPMMLEIVAWLPLVVMLIDGGIRNRKISWNIYAGGIFGATVLAGHPQITFFEGIFLTAYSAYVWISDENRDATGLVRAASTFFVAIGIGLIQVIPALEINSVSARADWSFKNACEGSISFRQLISMIMPKVFGAWTGNSDNIPPFWLKDTVNAGFYTYWETCFYTGAAILSLAFFRLKQIRKDRFVLFACVWGLFSLSVALGEHFFVYRLLFDYVPGFGSFRLPARILFTWCFILPVLAAYGLDEIIRISGSVKSGRLFTVITGVFAAAGLLTGTGLLSSIWPEMNVDGRAEYASRQGFILLVNALVPLISFFLLNKKAISKRVFTVIIIAGVVFDMLVFAAGQHINSDGGAPAVFEKNKSVAEAIKKEQRSGMFRANMRQFILEPDQPIIRQNSFMIINKIQGMVDRVQITEGYSPLSLMHRQPPFNGSNFDRFLDLLNVKYYVDPFFNGQSNNPILLNADYLPRAKMFYKTVYMPGDSLAAVYMNSPGFDYRNELVVTNAGVADKFNKMDSSAQGNVAILHYGINSIDLKVKTNRDGILWLSEIWYPAWKAVVDGKPVEILRVDDCFRGMQIPAGEHLVELRFSSGYFKTGLIVLVLTIVASGIFLVVLRRTF